MFFFLLLLLLHLFLVDSTSEETLDFHTVFFLVFFFGGGLLCLLFRLFNFTDKAFQSGTASFPFPHRMLSAKKLSPGFFFCGWLKFKLLKVHMTVSIAAHFFLKYDTTVDTTGSARQKGKLYRSVCKHFCVNEAWSGTHFVYNHFQKKKKKILAFEVSGCFWFVTLRISPIVYRVRSMNGGGCTAELVLSANCLHAGTYCSSTAESHAKSNVPPLPHITVNLPVLRHC